MLPGNQSPNHDAMFQYQSRIHAKESAKESAWTTSVFSKKTLYHGLHVVENMF